MISINGYGTHAIGMEMPEDCLVNEMKQMKTSSKSTAASQEMNLLILGETGVGKSTWINGFANFLKYASLDEAEREPGLTSLVPAEFTICNQNYEEVHVRTGSDANETMGSGHSATQACKVYTFTDEESSSLVRLIDTPGIGDTRGVEQDKKNFQNVLSTIANLEEIHGICILLKPNQARLGVMFRFCIQELLTYLHKDAAQNIIFCFTNSRGTFYRPGDTMPPLKKLLQENKKVPIPLDHQTVYCYDSEAYRFLAAIKNDPPVLFDEAERQSFVSSWDKSVAETRRMLQYIGSLKPHPVRSTMNLNQAKELVVKLARPLAEISRLILVNKSVLNDKMEEIKLTQANVADLQKQLMITVPALKIVKLDHPNTVCTNTSCKEFFGDNNAIKYTTICHDHCQLSGVTSDCVGHEGLLECWAIEDGDCRHYNCQHSYKEHMHIYYQSEETTSIEEDASIKKLLESNLDAVTMKEEMINDKQREIAELDAELKEIQHGSARFAQFLQANAIIPYSDAIIEYMDHLIKEEKDKVAWGGSENTLRALIQSRQEYVEEIEILKKGMAAGGGLGSSVFTPDQVQDAFKKLYGLKHYGAKLKEAVEAVNSAGQRAAAYREVRVPVRIPPTLKVPGKSLFRVIWGGLTGSIKTNKGHRQLPIPAISQ